MTPAYVTLCNNCLNMNHGFGDDRIYPHSCEAWGICDDCRTQCMVATYREYSQRTLARLANSNDHSYNVVTWMSDSQKLDICERCSDALKDATVWPKDSHGVEFCSVSHGKHRGTCGIPAQYREKVPA